MTQATMTQIEPPTEDFSSSMRVRFRIDHVDEARRGQPEFFDGVPMMPALSLIDFVATYEKMNEDNLDKATFLRIVDIALTDESAARFIERMESKEDPIGITQLMQIIPWLMEQYGMRPQSPSGPSSKSEPNPDGGTNSEPIASSPAPASTQFLPLPS